MAPFGLGRRRSGTRLFYASDVHGSERTWRKFLNAAKFYGADALVMGGDVMGKLAIPIIRERNGRYRATVHGRVERIDTEAELQQLRSRIADLGFYHRTMDEDEVREIRDTPGAVDRLFVELATARLMAWIDLAEERLAGTDVRCYASGGNDDVPEVMDAMERPGARAFVACEGNVIPIDEQHVMVSMPYVNPTPWRTPREADERELGERIAAEIAGIEDFRNVIFNFHAPPIDSTLDTCPRLDPSTDPPSQVVVAGQPVLYGAGSTSVREAIERHQPLLGLHGHIHEAQATARIGRTLAINPGSEYGEGILKGCLLTIDDGKVTSYQMTAG